MTYGTLKHLTNALLIGDHVLTEVDEELLALLSYAFDKVANEADALKLFTDVASGNDIIRQAQGNLYIRKPKLPTMDTDELDIDDELCYAVSRFICAFVSREKGGVHMNEARAILRLYNQKVQTFLENLAQDEYLTVYDESDKYGKRIYV